jgi:hypothetical protein
MGYNNQLILYVEDDNATVAKALAYKGKLEQSRICKWDPKTGSLDCQYWGHQDFDDNTRVFVVIHGAEDSTASAANPKQLGNALRHIAQQLRIPHVKRLSLVMCNGGGSPAVAPENSYAANLYAVVRDFVDDVTARDEVTQVRWKYNDGDEAKVVPGTTHKHIAGDGRKLLFKGDDIFHVTKARK